MTYEKLYQIGFGIATLYSLVMLPYNLERMKRVDTVEEKSTTSTEVLETERDGSEDLSEIIQTIGTIIPQVNASEKEPLQNTVTVKNVEKKPRTPSEIYEQVKHLGYRKEPAISLISTCKGSSRDPRHCILIGLVLMYNEAGNQQKSTACTERNNCFGIQSGKKKYSSLDEGMENWVQKYNRHWYKADNAKYFYPDLGKKSPSGYCATEKQHEPQIGCPDGQKIASSKWEKLYPIIY